MAAKGGIDPKSKADFDAAVAEFARDVRVSVEIIANEQMRLMLRDAMTFTPPMPKGGGRGLGEAAHKAGMNKLGNDVRRIFIAQDDPIRGRPVFLRKIIDAVRNQDRQSFYELHQDVTASKIKSLSPVMQAIMQDSNWLRAQAKAKNYLNKAAVRENLRTSKNFTTDLRPIHDKAKGAVGGRWPKNNKYKGPQYLIDSTSALNAYIADRQMKVGKVKAGYASILQLIPPLVNSKGKARNLGVYDAPWVDANRSSFGLFTMSKNGNSVSMTATNVIGNINNVAKEAGTENIVYGNRVKQIKNTIQARVRDAVERANRRK